MVCTKTVHWENLQIKCMLYLCTMGKSANHMRIFSVYEGKIRESNAYFLCIRTLGKSAGHSNIFSVYSLGKKHIIMQQALSLYTVHTITVNFWWIKPFSHILNLHFSFISVIINKNRNCPSSQSTYNGTRRNCFLLKTETQKFPDTVPFTSC